MFRASTNLCYLLRRVVLKTGASGYESFVVQRHTETFSVRTLGTVGEIGWRFKFSASREVTGSPATGVASAEECHTLARTKGHVVVAGMCECGRRHLNAEPGNLCASPKGRYGRLIVAPTVRANPWYPLTSPLLAHALARR